MINKLIQSKVAVALFSIAVLGLLVFGGKIALVAAQDTAVKTPDLLFDIGAKPVSLEQLKKETIDHGLSFYWLGEQPSTFLTINHETPGSITLSYGEGGQQNSVTDSPQISVSTYFDEQSYVTAMHGAVHVAPDTVVSNAKGDVVIINGDVPTEMLVKFKGTSTTVGVRYLVPQSQESLVRDSESLRLFDAS